MTDSETEIEFIIGALLLIALSFRWGWYKEFRFEKDLEIHVVTDWHMRETPGLGTSMGKWHHERLEDGKWVPVMAEDLGI